MHDTRRTGGARRAAAWLAAVLAAPFAAGAAAAAPEILVLSNRADLISGGDALVEVRWPAGAPLAKASVALNGSSVTAAFAVRADGRYVGLVTGLREGANLLTARVQGSGARIVVTNHPIGGPVISGEQVVPWTCTTKVASPTANNPDLGDPIDDKCNIAAPVYRYQYRTLTNTFATYNPASPPPANTIAQTTTDEGRTVPYIVRIERGVINRGKYDIAYLANPADPTAGWQPWSVPSSWNRKLFWKFGSGCDYQRTQASPGTVIDNDALGRGFMVASSEMTQYGTHCNDVTSAETVVMIKEWITEHYGQIRYTMSDGGSGGAHQQNLHSSNYPGLIQGMLPTQNFQDTWTPGREFLDCGLLKRYHDLHAGTPLDTTILQRGQIAGHRWNQVCEGPANTNMASRTPFYIDPAVGCNNPPDQWSPTNTSGSRCTLQDFTKDVLGARDATGYARTPLDNIGLQYGFAALNAGQISPEQFVTMNEQIGGYDINGQWQAARSKADPVAVQIVHKSGRITHGRYLGEVAIIDRHDFDITEEHYDFRSYVLRNRLLRDQGDYANQVIWRYKSTPPALATRAFDTMNRWLMAVEADQTPGRTLRQKILANKPAEAVDSCWRADQQAWSTDVAYCNLSANPNSNATLGGTGADVVPMPTIDEWPVYRDTRVAAGEGLTSDIMKCRLKRLNPADYAVAFTADQWARLQAAFPDGVCDWSQPGLGQQAPEPWQTFDNALAGGKPLGPPPVSEPL